MYSKREQLRPGRLNEQLARRVHETFLGGDQARTERLGQSVVVTAGETAGQKGRAIIAGVVAGVEQDPSSGARVLYFNPYNAMTDTVGDNPMVLSDFTHLMWGGRLHYDKSSPDFYTSGPANYGVTHSAAWGRMITKGRQDDADRVGDVVPSPRYYEGETIRILMENGIAHDLNLQGRGMSWFRAHSYLYRLIGGETSQASILITNSNSKITVTDIQEGDKVKVNGLEFSAVASGAVAADREFNIGGTDDFTANNLKNILENATYGVPSIVATRVGNELTLSGTTITGISTTPTTKPGFLRTAKGLAMTADGTRLYVADYGNYTVEVFDLPHGEHVLTISADLGKPYDLALDEENDKLYVSDNENDRIRVFTASTGVHDSDIGSSGTGDGQLDEPRGIAIGGEHLFVSDYGNGRIQRFSLGGTYQTKWSASLPDPIAASDAVVFGGSGAWDHDGNLVPGLSSSGSGSAAYDATLNMLIRPVTSQYYNGITLFKLDDDQTYDDVRFKVEGSGSQGFALGSKDGVPIIAYSPGTNGIVYLMSRTPGTWTHQLTAAGGPHV